MQHTLRHLGLHSRQGLCPGLPYQDRCQRHHHPYLLYLYSRNLKQPKAHSHSSTLHLGTIVCKGRKKPFCGVPTMLMLPLTPSTPPPRGKWTSKADTLVVVADQGSQVPGHQHASKKGRYPEHRRCDGTTVVISTRLQEIP